MKAPKLNRADIPYCVKGIFLIEMDEFEKAIICFKKLTKFINFDDPFALLSIAKIAYSRSILMRSNNIVEQSKGKNEFFRKID